METSFLYLSSVSVLSAVNESVFALLMADKCIIMLPLTQSCLNVSRIALTIMIFVNSGGGGYYFFKHARWNGELRSKM